MGIGELRRGLRGRAPHLNRPPARARLGRECRHPFHMQCAQMQTNGHAGELEPFRQRIGGDRPFALKKGEHGAAARAQGLWFGHRYFLKLVLA
jgi:hypothetical protein